MYTPKEVAEELHFEANTIRKWINSKKIRAIKFGGRWMIPEEEVKRLKREGTLK